MAASSISVIGDGGVDRCLGRGRGVEGCNEVSASRTWRNPRSHGLHRQQVAPKMGGSVLIFGA